MKTEQKQLTGYASIDKPWLKYYPEEIKPLSPDRSIYQYLLRCNKDHLNDTALDYYGVEISYGQLLSEIDRAAEAFVSVGVKSGDIVVINSITTPETIYSVYGLNKIGAISNMVDPRTSIEGIHHYIDEVSSKYVITIDAALPKIKEAICDTNVETIIVISPFDSLPTGAKHGGSESVKNQNNAISWKEFIGRVDCISDKSAYYQKNTCCTIVHTGGTTGFPKGVMLSNENFNEMVISFKYNGLSFERGMSLLSIMPPFIAYGIVNGIHVVLCRGMRIILVPQLDPRKMDDFVMKYRPTHMLATPTHYDALLTSNIIDESTDLSFVKVLAVGGDGLSTDIEFRLNTFLKAHGCNMGVTKGYGMTEVSAAACATRPENNAIGSVGLPFYRIIISAFQPNTDIELKAGCTGEICIFSPSTMLGYFDNQEETNRILRRHSDGRLWIHSGDIGYIREDGSVFISGRIKRIIVRHDGFKVFPAQIENAVTSHPEILSSCAVGVEDTQHSQGKNPLVFAVARPDFHGDAKELTSELNLLCQKELPEYAQPVGFRFIDALPLTPIGKVDYRALEKMVDGINETREGASKHENK